MPATHMQTRLDKAFVQPATVTPRRCRSTVKPLAAIAAPAKTKLNTEKSEQVSALMFKKLLDSRHFPTL